MTSRTPIFDLTLAGGIPGSGIADPGFGWSITLCPTCDDGVPMQVVDSGVAVIIQYCDTCSSRIGVESRDGSITDVVDVDDLSPWETWEDRSPMAGEPWRPRLEDRGLQDRAREPE